MTFGPTEEEGIAVSPDGRALMTSAGNPGEYCLGTRRTR
jgi:hypothetical protein